MLKTVRYQASADAANYPRAILSRVQQSYKSAGILDLENETLMSTKMSVNTIWPSGMFHKTGTFDSGYIQINIPKLF